MCRLIAVYEQATIRCLTQYREAIANEIKSHNGRVIDVAGDNVLAEFASAVDAVNCAVRVQEELGERNALLPSEAHVVSNRDQHCDVLVEGQRIYGDGVNIAARVEALAQDGGICLTGTASDQVDSKLDYAYDDLGE